jgi:acyl-CoA dehydrogenase
MVLAMHHIQVACIVHHGLSSSFFRNYLVDLVERQLLIASVTSENGVGGDSRTSICGLNESPRGFELIKDATTISYGEFADDLMVTARRSTTAAGNDQALVLLRHPDYTLEKKSQWDTLGMRGTCSPAFLMSSHGKAEQVFETPFAEISSETMVPVSHILWASMWLGMATGAVNKARLFVREQARRTPGTVPPTATRLAELWNLLQVMHSNVHGAMAQYDSARRAPDAKDQLSSMRFALLMNNLKVSASQQVLQIIQAAFQLCGIAAFKNDTKFSMGRQLRDAQSAAVMVGNDRILATNAALLLVHKDE